MTEHDYLIREARWAADWHESHDRLSISTLFRRLADALEARPSLVVRGEEELADAISAYRHGAEVAWTEDALLASSLIADGTVTVAPSLAAESREAVARYFFKRRTHLPEEDFDYLLERERRGRDGVPESIWAEADALLAPGGPVRLADATPEQGWEEGHTHCFHVEDPNSRERNPYDGFTRKEQNE